VGIVTTYYSFVFRLMAVVVVVVVVAVVVLCGMALCLVDPFDL
jgi:hypothetical protein